MLINIFLSLSVFIVEKSFLREKVLDPQGAVDALLVFTYSTLFSSNMNNVLLLLCKIHQKKTLYSQKEYDNFGNMDNHNTNTKVIKVRGFHHINDDNVANVP